MRIPRPSFRTRLTLAFVGLALGTAAVLLHLAWRRGRAAQLEALRTTLTTTTAAAAPRLDGDLHASIRWRPGADEAPGYGTLASVLASIKAANPRFHEVYTISLLDDDEPGFGRMAVSDEPRDAGKRYDMRRFPAMLEGRERPAADADVAQDEWGLSLSGYAPVRDARGRAVAVLGIDVDGATVEAMRAQLLELLAAGGGVVCLLAAAAGTLFARRISKPVGLLAQGLDKVAAGDFQHRVTWRSGDEMERLCDGFNAMGEALEERQRLKQALALAMEIQQHLLPASPPDVPGVDLAGFSDYCDETGGDYYDFPRTWALGGGRLAITVGDVTGHGIGAALLMSSARAVLRTHAERDEPPGALLALVNHALVHDSIAGKFMTLCYGVLDPAAGTLRYANAGQGGCYVLHADGRTTAMPALALPLGVLDDVEFAEGRVEGLVPGDVVLLASDGVWETVDARGELFGTDRMLEVARAHVREPAEAISAALRAAADAWRGTGPQTDDVTVLVARVARAGAPPLPAGGAGT